MEDARNYILAALTINPMYAEAYNNLGVLHRDEGNIVEARKMYAKALEINPYDDHAAQNNLLAMNCKYRALHKLLPMKQR